MDSSSIEGSFGLWEDCTYFTMKEELKFFPKYLAIPAQRSLAKEGIAKLYDLSRFTKAEIKELRGIGPDSMTKIKEDMFEEQISFKVDKSAYQ